METETVPSSLRSESLRAVLDGEEIRYSQVWEDFRCLEQAFDFCRDRRYLVIGSAGCNALNCLLSGAHVDVVDLSQAQLALLELKCAAISTLSHEEFLFLLGMRPGPRLYDKVREALTPETRDLFDRHADWLEGGLIHCGRLERFFRQFREKILRPLAPSLCDSQFLASLSANQQRDWLTGLPWPEIETAISRYFDVEGLTRGRSAAQMKYVTKQNVGAHFFKKFKAKMENAPIAENFYLHFFLTGEPSESKWWPHYLRPENYAKLRDRLPFLKLQRASIQEFLQRRRHGYNGMILSDIFEYMSPTESEALFHQVRTRLKPGGRLAYWTLLVDRQAPHDLRCNLAAGENGAAADRLWFYDRFYVYERGDA